MQLQIKLDTKHRADYNALRESRSRKEIEPKGMISVHHVLDFMSFHRSEYFIPAAQLLLKRSCRARLYVSCAYSAYSDSVSCVSYVNIDA
jgi:hypothetical protein